MENKGTTNHHAIDEIAKRELTNLEIPYNAYDWEKVEHLLANYKAAKGSGNNRFTIPVKKAESTIGNISTFKKFNFSNIIFGIVVIIGVVVLLFRIFDNSPSEDENILQTQVGSGSDEELVRGMDTLKTIPHKVVKESLIPPVKETPSAPVSVPVPKTAPVSTVAVVATKHSEPTTQPRVIEKKPDASVKKTEPKTATEKPKNKVKMEVEEIEEIEIPSRPTSLVKRKKEPAAIQPSAPAAKPVTEPIQEKEANFDESKRELRKRKRDNTDIEKEQRPKTFRELDSIH